MEVREASGTRPYENRNRLAQAAQTRQRVLGAAARLFARDGYAATTIQGLADEAGVAVQTVYAAFGSKRQVLKQLFDTTVVGDTDDVALVDRPEWRAWEEEPDPIRKIEAFARTQRLISERAAQLHGIMHAAAAADTEIAELYRESEQARYRDQARLANQLSRQRELRSGLTRRRAADMIWALAGPAIYNQLVEARGWRAQEYEEWLALQLRFALLGNDTRQTSRP